MAIIITQNTGFADTFFGLRTTALAEKLIFPDPIVLTTPFPGSVSTCESCPYKFKVLADLGDASLIRNDFSAFLFEFPFTNTSFTFNLEKETAGTFFSVATLNNNTLGTFYDLGSLFRNTFAGFKLDWNSVLSIHGEGNYRFKMSANVFTISRIDISGVFCLKAFSDLAADNTVRFDFRLQGKIGNVDIDGRLIDIGDQLIPGEKFEGWINQLRVEGFFGYETTEYETEEIEFQTGEIQTVKDEALQKFIWTSGLLPKAVHDRIKVYVLMADDILITDYNLNNAGSFVLKSIRKDGSYEPDYTVYNKLSRVTVDMKEGIQNLIKSRC